MQANRVLLVDDEANVLASLERHLRKDYEVSSALNGISALEMLDPEHPFSVIVADYRMPGMNGAEFLAQVRKVSPDSVRIMLTGQADLEQAIDIVNQGQVFRFLMKPCPSEVFLNAVQAGTEQYRLLNIERDLLEKTLRGSVKTLFDILALTSPGTFNQSVRIRPLATKIASQLGFTQIWEVEMAALLCKIGCVTIPKEILEKYNRGDPLNVQEKELYFSHPRIGKSLVENIPRLENVAEAIAYQYKHFSGTGIPDDGKKGEEIPFMGRLLKILIDYDDHSRGGKEVARGIMEMKRNRDMYDPQLFTILEAEVLGEWKNLGAELIPLNLLDVGMVLANDLIDRRGSLLLTAGTVITPVLKNQLWNYHQFNKIVEPVFVYEKKQEA